MNGIEETGKGMWKKRCKQGNIVGGEHEHEHHHDYMSTVTLSESCFYETREYQHQYSTGKSK
jgi:hypothetical protein